MCTLLHNTKDLQTFYVQFFLYFCETIRDWYLVTLRFKCHSTADMDNVCQIGLEEALHKWSGQSLLLDLWMTIQLNAWSSQLSQHC